MHGHLRFIPPWRSTLIALLLAMGVLLGVPTSVSAHAILLRSDPAKDAVLPTAPQQVHLWFSEDLNPAFSTATVVNGASVRVDRRDVHVSSRDSKEMDLTLPPNLPPAVYIVIYRTDSNDDGHVLTGSFLFTVARPDGTVPTLDPGAHPGTNALGGTPSGAASAGQFDGLTLFNLIVITLVELGTVFWVGAHLFQRFVLQPATGEHPELAEATGWAELRVEQLFALPTLLVLGLSNLGVLIGQAIPLTDGHLAQAFSPILLMRLGTSGRFGTYWLLRGVVILIALGLSLAQMQVKPRDSRHHASLRWAQLILGIAFLIALTMSSHAAAVSQAIAPLALVADFLHLVAAALWVGGMLYLATIYLPVLLARHSIAERAFALVTVLPYYSFYAGTGVILMALTGPLSATVHLASWEQLVTTAYGRTLLVKVVLVGGLLLTSAFHVLFLRPHLRKEHQKYASAQARLRSAQTTPALVAGSSGHEDAQTSPTYQHLSRQVKLRERRVAQWTRPLTQILRWEPVLGVAVLVCVGLMNVFAGTLSPTASAPPQAVKSASTPFHTTVKTTDGKFTLALAVSPNTAGPNVFMVSVIENATGRPTTNVGVSLYTTHLDMDMGTDTLNLQPDGKDHFSASGDLVMGGHWQIRIQVRTLENTLHEVKITMLTPF